MAVTANDNNGGQTWSPHIVHQSPGVLKPALRNARVHSVRQITQIVGSIRQFGFTNPVLVNSDNRIVTGHGRVRATLLAGLSTVPTIQLSHLDDAELRALALADNKLALNSGWDDDLLKLELGELCSMDMSFDLEITGFSTPEIDLIEGKKTQADAALDKGADREPAAEPVTVAGDLWRLGSHRLFCGDSRDEVSFAVLMGEDKARAVVSDPPFNVRVDGHVCGAGAIRHKEFAMASGEMSRPEFTGFLQTVFAHEAAYSLNGALHFQFMDWRHVREMMAAGEEVYSELKNICVWVKDSAGMGSLYRSQHEFVFVWKVGTDLGSRFSSGWSMMSGRSSPSSSAR